MRPPTPPRVRPDIVVAWFAAVSVAGADQLSKDLTAQPLRNSGYAFEIVTGGRGALVVGAFVVLGGFAALTLRFASRLAISPVLVAMTLAGSASNLLDRIVLGSVRDFISLGAIVFNVADVAVAIGVVGIAAAALLHAEQLAESLRHSSSR